MRNCPTVLPNFEPGLFRVDEKDVVFRVGRFLNKAQRPTRQNHNPVILYISIWSIVLGYIYA